MTLLVCPVRPGDNNEELRFALRSWETNLILPNLSLMVVGYCPSWLDPDYFIEGNRHASAPLAVFDNVRLGAEGAAEKGHEVVVYMNDDFFCMDPVGALLPVKRNCTLAEHIANAGQESSWWGRSLRLTASWLSEEGFPHPDSYEVHRPLVARPDLMLDVYSRWESRSTHLDTDDRPQWRTMYGVLNKVDSYPVTDAKMMAAMSNKPTGIGTPWISTSDHSWRRWATAIGKRFQKPSRWEKPVQR